MPVTNPDIILYVRKKLGPGNWKWERVEEIRGRHTSSIHGKFAFRPTIGGKQQWVNLEAQSFDEAKFEAGKLLPGLQAKAAGLTVVEIEARNGNRLTLKAAIATYLEQSKNLRPKSLAQYATTLNQFDEAARITYLDEIEGHPEVLRRYLRYMQETMDYEPKTIDTRMNIVFFLLKENGVRTRIKMRELPKVEEEPVEPYTKTELKKLFDAMDPENRLRYRFFLGTACREQEVMYATWADVNWEKKEYRVQQKKDVDFKPKSHQVRITPIPDELMEALKERHKNPPSDRWIFINGDGNPETHFLDKLKRIALEAGVNCGHCQTMRTVQRTVGNRYEKQQIEVSCKTHPVCERIKLHRFRKTCATRWHRKGVDVRTIQHWLGHKSLETTQLYLGITESTELRDKINSAYGD
jgi:integrase/recombinase XerD